MNKAICAEVVDVLEDLQASVLDIYVPGFEFDSRMGICWHVAMNSQCGYTFLGKTFTEMGLDDSYPVEHQIYSDYRDAAAAYREDVHTRYNEQTQTGKLRVQLLDNLVTHFKAKLKVLEQVEQTEQDLDQI